MISRWSKKHSADKSQAVAGAIGSTALHVACVNGCTRNVGLLLRNGAKTNVKDKYGSRPIDLAVAKHHVEIVKLLKVYDSSDSKGPQQEGTKLRRSVDMSYSTNGCSREHLRRPSLPCILESRNSQTNIPPVPSLPPSRNSLQHSRPFIVDLYSSHDIHTKPPELTSLKSSDGSEIFGTPPTSTCESYSEMRHDYYSYGVIDHFEGENYLVSLERRAFGHSTIHDDVLRPSTESANSCYRHSLESTPLQRYSSDGDYLRTVALSNASNNNSTITNEALPRPSIYVDRPDADTFMKQDKESKKTWWNSIMGGYSYKYYSDYPMGHSSLDSNPHRSSIDYRPSIDSLSHLAKRSVEGLSCKNTEFSDIYARENEPKKTNGFISRWVGNWSTKK
jgi:hypothetical protein